ncbi:MAG: glycine cleavage system aminomethyltransferase GcvT [Gammaproteobacteria bacterium]|nr:glycine cleavage system aminomethyltransferase GcvT [Gammaproteobacteria bacterium]
MIKKTPLHACHIAASARMVNFSGWDMPLHYGSQIKEHLAVRQDAGMFDVSHMATVDITGPDAAPYLRHLLANNIDRLTDGKGLYSCLLNHEGGIIDDLITYRLSEHFYRIVVNAGTREKDLAWFREQAKNFNVEIRERTDLAMIAVQGPRAHERLDALFPYDLNEKVKQLAPFHVTSTDDWCVARTGYTGEDGVEIILPNEAAASFWDQLLAAGIAPCGLGARDTLRLEAGLNLYGSDMNENVTPLESNLAWTVAFTPEDRQFIGRDALLKQRAQGVAHKLVGLVNSNSGILRAHQIVKTGSNQTGEITSGSFSPTLNISIALARVPANVQENCTVEIRDKAIPVKIVKPPFVRKGQPNF